MSAARKIIDKKILRELVPLNTLSQARFEEISGKIAIQEVRADHYLFRVDDRDNQTVYLLGGEISLLDGRGRPAGTIIAGSNQSRHPLANVQPRPLSARAEKKCVVARIDSSLLDAFLSWDQSNNAEAVAIGADENEDWMTHMLQSQAYEKMPPAKIQKLLLKMEAINLEAGTTVVRQGEDGDFFYTIQSGKCAVTRRDTPQAEDQLLAELSGGDCFGEEALVSDVKRNATVSMLTDGVLMRLAKEDFIELLQKPLIRYVDYAEAALMVDEGAVWVDVRTAGEYERGALEDSVNIPFDTVRGEIPELVFNVSYVICCESGKSSGAAAFILGHKGFDVYVLRGGLRGVPENLLSHALGEPQAETVPADTREGAEPVEHRGPVSEAAADTETASRIAGLEQQITELHAQKQRLESDLARAHKKRASIERVVEEHKKLHKLGKQQLASETDKYSRATTALQDETRKLENRINNQAERLVRLLADKQAAEAALDSKMQEWVSERTFFKSENDEAQLRIADLQKQLDQARERDSGDRSELRKELDQLLISTNKKIENKEFQCVELRQSQSRLQADLEVIQQERNGLQQKLAKANNAAEKQQNEIDTLEARLESMAVDADEQVQAFQLHLETMRLQHEDAKRQAVDRLAQLNKIQNEMDSMKAARARLEQEASVLGRQKEELQHALEQREIEENVRQVEHEQLLKNAHDELTRKTDVEQELLGQVDRLRKKLEQTTLELQHAREAELSDIDSIREELHTERSARSAERAEMAARQRELKDQLAAVATEHEQNLIIQSDAIEQARLQQMHETRLETGSQLEELQHQLKQATDEIAELEKREKKRRNEEKCLSEEQRQQYESSLEQLRTQMEQLLQERDAALMEQRAMLEKINGLRAGIDVEADSEDVSRLRRELDETRKNAEVAIRLRTEAETACARIRKERDMLQKQVSNNLSLGRPLNLPSPGPKTEQFDRPAFTAEPAKTAPAAALKTQAVATGRRIRGVSGAVRENWARLAKALGLGVIVIAALPYGLQSLTDHPEGVVSQMLGYADDFSGTPTLADQGGNQETAVDGQAPVHDQRAVAEVESARPVVQSPRGVQPSPVTGATRASERPQAVAQPAIRQQGQVASGFSTRNAAPPLEPPKPVMEPVTAQQPLSAVGSFRDNLKDGGNAPMMVKLPAGSFMMGSKGNSLNFDERPQHEVSLVRFAISKYEVTFADYDRFARATGVRLPHDETWGRGDHPIINVSWKEAQAYVRWLSAQTGHSYRLPGEAQWEFAARAGSTAPHPWDSQAENVPANCFDCGSEWDHARTAPVGSFPANSFGLHDMGGNVQEWTEDCYRAGYDGAPADGSPLLIPGCTQHAVRGGAYTGPIQTLRSASRAQYDEDTRLDNLGFRVVREY